MEFYFSKLKVSFDTTRLERVLLSLYEAHFTLFLPIGTSNLQKIEVAVLEKAAGKVQVWSSSWHPLNYKGRHSNGPTTMANGDTSVVTNHRTTPSKLNKNNNTHPNGTAPSQDATNASAQQLNGNHCQVSMGFPITVIKKFNKKKCAP